MNANKNVERTNKDVKKSWWSRRSKLEKGLLLLLLCLAIAAILLAIVDFIVFKGNSQTCLSKNCIKSTNELRKYMDTNANPCDDFYQFACGKFVETAELGNKVEINMATSMLENIDRRIRKLIDNHDVHNSTALAKAKRLYDTCVNRDLTEEGDLELLKSSLKHIGGWQILEKDNWNPISFDWMSATYKLRTLGFGFDFLIRLHVEEDETRPSRRILKLNGPWKSSSRITQEDEKVFHALMVNVSVLLGADRLHSEKEFKDVIGFIRSMFSNSSKSAEEKEGRFKISELQYKFPDIPWLEYINQILFPAPTVSYDQVVIIDDIPYFYNLQNSLRKTNKKVINNYIGWRTIIESSMYLPKRIRSFIFKYYNTVNERTSTPMPKVSAMCTKLAMQTFPLALESAYVQRYIPKETKKDVSSITENIKNKFKEMITRADWIDAGSREKALEKVHSSKIFVAYSDDLMNFNKIDEVYLEYEVYNSSLLASLLSSNYHKMNALFNRLNEDTQIDNELNDDYTLKLNIYFSALQNTLVIPDGLLNGVMYDIERPQYLKYGALGSAVAHQLIHTIFERNCEGEEIPSPLYLFSTQTMLNLNEKLSCIAMHYGKYFVPEIQIHLNSTKTRNEDFADISGIQLAYEAYSQWIALNGNEQSLPGLPYTPKQWFWIAAAIKHCQKQKKDFIESAINYYSVSPGKFRVLGALRNLKDFAKDFNCSDDSYMNDKRRCDIW